MKAGIAVLLAGLGSSFVVPTGERPVPRLRPQLVMVDERGHTRGWTFCVEGRAVYVSVRAIAQGAIGSCPYIKNGVIQ